MKRKLWIVAGTSLAGLLGAAVVAFFVLKGAEFTFSLSKEDLQAAIDSRLPYEKKFALIFVLTVKNTKVFLTEGSDRIGCSTDLELNAKLEDVQKNLGGYIKSEAGIRYDQEKFCFYLLKPELQDLWIQGIPEKYTTAVSVGTKLIIRQYLEEVIVYRISDRSLQRKLARCVLKRVNVVNGRLVITLGY